MQPRAEREREREERRVRENGVRGASERRGNGERGKRVEAEDGVVQPRRLDRRNTLTVAGQPAIAMN
jgi:hypothetical protein